MDCLGIKKDQITGMQCVEIIIALCLQISLHDIKYLQIIVPVGTDAGAGVGVFQHKYLEGRVESVNILKKYIFFIYWFHFGISLYVVKSMFIGVCSRKSYKIYSL